MLKLYVCWAAYIRQKEEGNKGEEGGYSELKVFSEIVKRKQEKNILGGIK